MLFFFVLVFSVSFFIVSKAKAAFNETINYQGKLTDSSNVTVADGAYDVVFKLYNVPTGGAALWTESLTGAALWSDAGTTITKDAAGCGGAGNTQIVYTSNTNEATILVGQTIWDAAFKESATVSTINTVTNTICIANPVSAWANGNTITNQIYVKSGIFSVMMGAVTTFVSASVDFNQALYLGVKIGSDAEMTPRKMIGAVPSAFNSKKLLGGDWASPGAIGATVAAAGTFTNLSTTTGGLSIASGQSYTGAGAVTLSSGAGTGLTITGNSASTFGTTAGNITLQAAGAGTTANVQIGAGGAGSATPDMLVLDVGSAEPAGTNGAMYYSTALNSFRCYQNNAWANCIGTGGGGTLQTAYTASTSPEITLNSTNGGLTIVNTAADAIAGNLLEVGNNANNTYYFGVTKSGSTFNANAVSSGTGLSVSATGITNGKALSVVGGSAVTTGSDLYLNGAVYQHVAGETGNLANFAFTDNSNVAGASYTNGLDIDSTFNLQGASGAKQVNGLNISAPVINGCSGGNTCAFDAIQTNFQTNSNASISQVGLNIIPANTTAGSLTGIAIGSIGTPGASATENAITIGTGWDSGLSIASGGATITGGALAINNATGITSNQASMLINVNGGSGTLNVQNILTANSITTSAGGVSIAAGQSYTGAGAVTLSSGAATGLTLNSANNTLTIASSNTALTASGLTTFTLGANAAITNASGNMTLQPAGAATTATVQIGAGGAGSTTPDLLGLDVRSNTAGEPAGANGNMFYSTYYNAFRCYVNGAWKNCNTGALIGRQTLVSGTTYTPTAGTNSIMVRICGAGGGGGGATGGTTAPSVGGGGGSGSYAEKYFTGISGTYAYALGTAGTAGTATGSGGNGGNTTFTGPGALTVTANGGSGGTYLATGTTLVSTLGGAGGAISTNGDVNMTGAPGEYGMRISTTAVVSGNGGSSPFGGGGVGKNVAAAGSAGTGYCSGGGGAVSTSSTGYAGGAGTAGEIVVWEYN